MPTFGSLFAGIGGFDLGLERAGWTCRWQVEIDPFCQRVLAARWPGIERAADVRGALPGAGDCGQQQNAAGNISDTPARESIDLLTGGFPCQDLSVAGKRAGLGGERSGLFWEIVRIAKEVCPPWGLFENVPGLLSSHSGRDMWAVLQGLRECWPAVGYRILDSRYFGVAQRRRRVFFVCGPTEAGVAQVLALFEGGSGDSQAGGEAGAATPGAACFGTLNSGGNRGGFRTEPGEHLVTHALSAGAGGSKFGSGRDGQDDFVIAETLSAGSNPNSNMAGRRREDDVNLVTGPLGGGNDGIGRRSEDDPNLVVQGEIFTLASRGRGDSHQLEFRQDGLANAILTPNGGSAVRRLTPVECERLQAFPDGWTCLCQPLEAYAADPDEAALRCTCPDSPRYRALGNAVTVSVVEWLGLRLITYGLNA